jgi:hypothetical protein
MKHISEAIINIGITHAILSRYIPLSFAILNLKLKQTSGLAFRTETLFSSSFNIPTKRFGITIVSNVVYHVQTKSSKQMFWVINNSLDMMILIFDRS